MAINLMTRLGELGKISKGLTPVVSVYLDTRWADEHQRDRVRVFLKNELARAREASSNRAADSDLDWIESQGNALVGQATMPEGVGVALFACERVELREHLSVRVPFFEDAFVVADRPFLRPLAVLVEATPAALLIFVDGESARLWTITAAVVGAELVLEAETEEHPRIAGGPETTQAVYDRRREARREHHFVVVAKRVVELVDSERIERLIVAGEPRNMSFLRNALPPFVAEYIVGEIAGSRDEAGHVLVRRAAEVLARAEGQRHAEEVDTVLVTAAKGGKAAAGVDAALEAVKRGAVHRLYLLRDFGESGRVCAACGDVRRGSPELCGLCGKLTRPVDLAEAMVHRVISTGGTVAAVPAHVALGGAGGVAVRLRFPL
jgi:protein required for attachment to host cells